MPTTEHVTRYPQIEWRVAAIQLATLVYDEWEHSTPEGVETAADDLLRLRPGTFAHLVDRANVACGNPRPNDAQHLGDWRSLVAEESAQAFDQQHRS